MPNKYNVGDVFYIDEGHDPHYHIIILASVNSKEPMYLIVYLSSSKTMVDRTTTFNKNEDTFIDRFSWVKYQSAYIISETDLDDGRIIRYQCKAKSSTVDKISADLPKAKRAPNYIRERFADWKSDQMFSSI